MMLTYMYTVSKKKTAFKMCPRTLCVCTIHVCVIGGGDGGRGRGGGRRLSVTLGSDLQRK